MQPKTSKEWDECHARRRRLEPLFQGLAKGIAAMPSRLAELEDHDLDALMTIFCSPVKLMETVIATETKRIEENAKAEASQRARTATLRTNRKQRARSAPRVPSFAKKANKAKATTPTSPKSPPKITKDTVAGSKEKLKAVDEAILDLGRRQKFVIGDVLVTHQFSRGVAAAGLKRLLKRGELKKFGSGKQLTYETKQLELKPSTNGAAAHA